MQNIPALNGLRAIAAFTVVLAHFTMNTDGKFLNGFFDPSSSAIGVRLFFAISGFLMGYLYLRTPATGAAAVGFCQKRVARVFPLYLFVVFTCFLINSVVSVPWIYPITTNSILKHILFIEGDWSLWTVPVEVQFYVLFLLLWLTLGRQKWLLFSSLIGATILVTLLPTDGSTKFKLLYCCAPFLVGTAAAMLPAMSSRLANCAFAAAALAFVVTWPTIQSLFGGIITIDLYKSWLSITILGALIFSAAHAPVAQSLLGGRLANYLGDRSYSVYLVHLPPLVWLKFSPQALGIDAVSYLAFVVGVSELTYRFIEVPSRRFINGFRYPRRSLGGNPLTKFERTT